MAALYAMSRELAGTRGVPQLREVAVRHIGEVFRARVVVLLPQPDGRLAPDEGDSGRFQMDANELAVGQWVHERGQVAGQGTDTLPGSSALYVPLTGSRGTVGVLGLRPEDPRALQAPEQLHQLEAFASQTALAIERARLAEEAEQAQVRAETERLRNSLLSSVSHDLRTPLASILASAGSLQQRDVGWTADQEREFAAAIEGEASRLDRIVGNLLDLSRLESGALQPDRGWYEPTELISEVASRLRAVVEPHPLTLELPDELPPVQLDYSEIDQVLTNLIENAAKYSPADAEIRVAASIRDGALQVSVAGRGSGISDGAMPRLFDPFFRGTSLRRGGSGLGLAVARGLVEAHEGRIWAENIPGGGARFTFEIPVTTA
jgi:two-component system sensor histidine kinase KdpD